MERLNEAKKRKPEQGAEESENRKKTEKAEKLSDLRQKPIGKPSTKPPTNNKNTKKPKMKEWDSNVYAVIMAGGIGSRFWPLSRRALPKQFIDLPDCSFDRQNSMLHQTAERVLAIIPKNKILVATSDGYEGLAAEALPWLESENLVVEKEHLDTAFGMAESLLRINELLAMSGAQDDFAETKVVFLPCDHYIEPGNAFGCDLELALNLAAKNCLVTLGILPDEPISEYGYMIAGQKMLNKRSDTEEIGEGILKEEAAAWYIGESFVEKPRKKQAEALLARGDVFWNSGIFIGRAGVFAEVLHRSLFGSGSKKQTSEKQNVLPNNLAPEQKIQRIIDKMIDKRLKASFDKLVMENLSAGEFLVVPASFVWDDLGTFGALAKYWQEKDGNRVHGCTLAAEKSIGNIVYRDGGLVALVDVDNLLVAEADGVLLIMPKDKSRHLKKTVEILQERNLTEYL